MSTSRTIVQIVAYYPPHLGGMENVVKSVSDALEARGHDVLVLTSNIPNTSVEPRTTVQRLWSFEFAHIPFAPALLYRLLRVPKNSILHLHLAQAFWPDLTRLVAALRRMPLVIHFHLDVEPSGFFGSLFVIYKKLSWGPLLRAADRVIVFSDTQAKLVETKYSVPARTIVVIPNGVSEEAFAAEAKRELHTPLSLLYVGRLDAQKRVDRILEAMARLDIPATLTIVGDGELRSELEALVRERGLANVSFEGRRGGKELQAYYERADILLTSSDSEGMSLVALEALAAGLPIIGSDVIGTRELVGDVGVLVREPYPENFASAITKLASNQEEWKRLSELSLAKARQYSWGHIIHRLEEVYQSL